MTTAIDVTEGNAKNYGRKYQWNLTHSGRNKKRFPGGRIPRLTPDDHYKKPSKKRTEDYAKNRDGISLNLKHVQGDKILEQGEGINKRPKESTSYQRLKRSCHKGTEINFKSLLLAKYGTIWL